MPNIKSYTLTVYLKNGDQVVYKNITRNAMMKKVRDYQELKLSLTFHIDWEER
jgi:hypothetical protein